tara:strand:+ start:2262 stop:3146 length:885 start_codon:yes stop_codon:yes gene_type:complete
MAETLNVNVIVAAKEEYTKQLITILQPDIYEVIRNIFINSQRNNIRRSLSYSNFQKELKNVPSWSNYTLEEYLQKINQKYPYLMDLITAIFVSHVKILACVRIKADDKSIKIKVPNLNNFLHKIIINVSEHVYYYPAVIDQDKDKFFSIISGSITDAISNQVPIEYILNEYLSGAFDEEDVPPLLDTQEVNEPLFDPNDDVESEPDDDFKRDIQISDIGRMASQLNVDVPTDNTDDVVVPPVSQPPTDVFENAEQSHISKSDNIEDSSDDDSDGEDYGDEDEKKTVITTQPALF